LHTDEGVQSAQQQRASHGAIAWDGEVTKGSKANTRPAHLNSFFISISFPVLGIRKI